MLYFVLSIVIRIALKIFFRKITIHGEENIPRSGSVIVVGNHPNTFMDPILTAFIMLPRQVHFLANGSIFKTRAARMVLNQFNTIPVYRKQDITEQRDEKNVVAIQKSIDFLGAGGVLLIFPEGNSFNERKLRPIKTGTARIALGTESQFGPSLPLSILPVGLNYSNPTRFREEVLITIGKPFTAKPYSDYYENEPASAVADLTAEVHRNLASLIVVTGDREEDDLVRKIESIYKKQLGLMPKTRTIDVNLTQTIVKALNYFREHNPQLVREVKEKIDNYFQTIKDYNVSDYLVEKSEVVSLGKRVRYLVYLISGFPFYVAGLVFNYLPYILPAKLARWISKDEEYKAPIMMTAGIFTFPLYYTLIGMLGWTILPNPYFMLALVVLMPLSGFFVLLYYKRLRNSKSTLAWHRIFKKQKTTLDWFTQQRQEIIGLLESARKQYS
jgi:glycerol-3-phosphate O-acyltransferase / dihydroxyacetone phosphate acyltransferase